MKFDFKNATKEELTAKYKEIEGKSGDTVFFTRKELNYLPEILMPWEQVIAFSSGMMDNNTWLIVLTDQRIIFLNKGLIYGLQQTSIDLDKVNGVEGKTGIVFGEIHINDGSIKRQIKQVMKKSVKPFTNLIQETISARKNMYQGGMQPPQNIKHAGQSPAMNDPYEKIEKLANLREKNIITEEEFQAEKRKILG